MNPPSKEESRRAGASRSQHLQEQQGRGLLDQSPHRNDGSGDRPDPLLLTPHYKDQMRPAGFEAEDGVTKDGASVPMAQSVHLVIDDEPTPATLPAAVMPVIPAGGINAKNTVGTVDPPRNEVSTDAQTAAVLLEGSGQDPQQVVLFGQDHSFWQ